MDTKSQSATATLSSTGVRRPHPVADNLLRLVAIGGPISDATEMADRLRELIDGVRMDRTPAVEPSRGYAARRRTLSDYVSAAAAVMDPERLALAMAFAPDEWRGDALSGADCWPLRTANWYLLYAEAGGRGDVTQAELLAQALAAWDQPALAHEQLQLANGKAFSLTGFGVCSARLQLAAGQELTRVIERYVESMGAQLGLGELLLLDQIQRLQWIPRPNLTQVEGLTGSFPLVKLITEFLSKSQAVMEQEDFTTQGIQDLKARAEVISAAAKCRLACQSLADHEVLQPTQEVTQELNTRYAMIGLMLALRNHAWQEAAQMVQGLSLDRLRPEPDETLRQSLGFGLRAIPLIAGHFREPNPQIFSNLEGQREIFPLVGPLIQELAEAVRAALPPRRVQEPAPVIIPLIAEAPEPMAPRPLSTEPTRLTPRIKGDPGQRAQPSILAGALGWDDEDESMLESDLEIAREIEILKDVSSPEATRLAGEEAAATVDGKSKQLEVIAPMVDANGKIEKPRRTNRFKVVSPNLQDTPEAEKASQAARDTSSEPKRRILAKLAVEDKVIPAAPAAEEEASSAEPAAEDKVVPAKPAADAITGDTLRGRPIPTPVQDAKVLPGTALHQTPRLHGFASRQRTRDKSLDAIPGRTVDEPAAAKEAPLAASAPETPAAMKSPWRPNLVPSPATEPKPELPPATAEAKPLPIEPIAALVRPQAGKRLRGTREAQLGVIAPPPEKPLATEEAGALAPKNDLTRAAEKKRFMRHLVTLVGPVVFIGICVLSILHGPAVLKKLMPGLVEAAPKSSADPQVVKFLKTHDLVDEPGSPIPSDNAEATPDTSGQEVTEDTEVTKAPKGPPAKPASSEDRRVARDVFAPIEPLKNFIQGQNSPFSQPAEVRVMSGDLGENGESHDSGAAETLSTNEVLRQMSNRDNAWDQAPGKSSTSPTQKTMTVAAQPVADEPKKQVTARKAPAIPALALFDDDDSTVGASTVATDDGKPAVFEPIRAADDDKPEPSKKAAAAPAKSGPATKVAAKEEKLKVKEIIFYALGGKDDVKAAMINDWVYQEGEELVDFSTGNRRSFKVVRIQPEEVVLKGDSGEITLPYLKHAQL